MSGEKTLETFSMMSNEALRVMLRGKGLKVNGNKETLAARAFSAWEFGIPDLPDKESVEKQNIFDYKNLLNINGQTLPDPLDPSFQACTSWVNESDNGMKLWPPVYLSDITEYLRKYEHDFETANLRKRLLNDYKDRKAFSFFSSKWLQTVYYHGINEASSICFLSARCTPSERINDIPYKAWASVNKKDGTVYSAYCTCYAGLGQSCVHIIAMLLKVDYCWRFGYTNPSCTSQECVWKAGGGKRSITTPKMIKDMHWEAPTALGPVTKKKLVSAKKKKFDPCEKSNAGMTFDNLLGRLKVTVPTAVYHTERSISIPEIEDKTEEQLPPTPKELAENVSVEDILKKYSQSLPREDIHAIQSTTVGQSNNPLWFKQKEGRISASKIHAICTRMQSAEKSNYSIDVTNTVKNICGYNKQVDLASLKHGRNMEPEAADEYIKHHKKTCDRNATLQENGLFVNKEKPFIAASPDRIVLCPKCGPGFLEIKCPSSISHTTPSYTSYKHLRKNASCMNLQACDLCANSSILKQNTEYYDQIQCQMACGQRDWCDFWVYTRHGHHCERIVFDPERWATLEKKTELFFTKYLVPELVNKSILKDLTRENDIQELMSCMLDAIE